MIGIIKSDSKVFANDKIVFDVSKSFFQVDEMPETGTNLEFSIDNGVTWVDVTESKQFSTVFSTSGTKTVKLKMTKQGSPTSVSQEFSSTVTVLDLAAAKLFATDSDLYPYEPEIDGILPERWSSWNLVHLRVQKFILDYLAERGYKKENGLAFTIDDFLNRDELNDLAVVKALEFIFEGNINLIGDISTQKRDKYAALSEKRLSRFVLSLDYLDLDDPTNEAQQTVNMHVIGVRR